MSLKFGIYLVEQRVISAAQFCGLVKIQQDSAQTMATIALRKNLMTIKQVNFLLDQMEAKPGIYFEVMALEKGLIDSHDLNILQQARETSCPPIRQLLVECGLLTHHQTKVLNEHFQKLGQATANRAATTTHAAAGSATPKPYMRKTPASAQQASPAATAAPSTPQAAPSMPMPKFQQRRPVIQKQPTNTK